MLDVHAPHETVHTWKDFVIHIATISVGLLIAVGLEQTVEHFHHLHQLDEARRELTSELEANREILNKNFAVAEKFKGQLEHNIALLHAAQSSRAPVGKELTELNYKFFWPKDGPWQVDKQNGSLGLMPHAELDKYTYLHETIAAIMDEILVLAGRASKANAIARRAPSGDFTAKDIEELLTATSESQASLDLLTVYLQLESAALKRDWSLN
jgi:hypothetical protein